MSYTIIKSATEAEWLEHRTKGIGGSEIGAILGLDEYRTQLDVYLDKKGREHDYSDDQLDDFDRGHWFEKPLLQWLSTQDGIPEFVHNESLYILNENPVIRCTPDGVGEDITIEGKSTKLYAKEPLQKWFLQLQYNMGITGHNVGIIVWIDCTMKRQYEIYNRNDELISMLQTEAINFWNNFIIPDISPAPMNSSDILNLYPLHTEGVSVEASVQDYEIYNSLIEAREMKEKYEEIEESCKEKLKVLMGEAEFLTYFGRVQATWRGHEEHRMDTKKFKKDHPDIFAEYAPAKTVRKFLPK